MGTPDFSPGYILYVPLLGEIHTFSPFYLIINFCLIVFEIIFRVMRGLMSQSIDCICYLNYVMSLYSYLITFIITYLVLGGDFC